MCDCSASETDRLWQIAGVAVSAKEGRLRGIRHLLRDFTATAVKEHLRSQVEDTGRSPELTKNEIELVRFILNGQIDWDAAMAGRLGRS
jgi:hypothetical protein